MVTIFVLIQKLCYNLGSAINHERSRGQSYRNDRSCDVVKLASHKLAAGSAQRCHLPSPCCGRFLVAPVVVTFLHGMTKPAEGGGGYFWFSVKV